MNAPRQANDRTAALLAPVLAELPLNDPLAAGRRVLHFLASLREEPQESQGRLDTLELLRPSVAHLRDQISATTSRHAVAPDSPEDAAFSLMVQVLEELGNTYERLAADAGRSQNARWLALAAQRSVDLEGQLLIEHFLARRKAPPGAWLTLHRRLQQATERQAASLRVPDLLHAWGQHLLSPRESHAALLLVDLANPYSRGLPELRGIIHWAFYFARGVELIPARGGEPAKTYVVDPSSDQAVRSMQGGNVPAGTLCLVHEGLGKSLQAVLGQFKAGSSLREQGLSSPLSDEDTRHLLTRLYRPWCLGAAARRFPRRKGNGTAQLCAGFPSIFLHVWGEAAGQDGHSQHHKGLEEWEVADESLGGFRLVRRQRGRALDQGQLLGLRPSGGGKMLLAHVSWLMFEGDGTFQIGIAMVPGTPEAVRVRNQSRASANALQGFLMSGVAALREQASVVLPTGSAEPGDLIEVLGVRGHTVLLDKLLQSGGDFDRFSLGEE